MKSIICVATFIVLIGYHRLGFADAVNNITLADLPQTFSLKEGNTEGAESVSVTITDASLRFGEGQNVTYFDDGASSGVSDLLVIKNDAAGHVTICFASDDSSLCTKAEGMFVTNPNASESAGPDIRIQGLTDPNTALQITVSSDKEGTAAGAESDSLKIERTTVPEPPIWLLLGSGVIGSILRRRRSV
jgi:hypothetical protein